jgi:hypothetical protein
LQRAQDLLDQSEDAINGGDALLGRERALEGMRALQLIAQSQPEIAAVIFAGMRGYSGYEMEIVERVDRHELVERKLFGLTIGHEVVNVPTITRRIVRGRLL